MAVTHFIHLQKPENPSSELVTDLAKTDTACSANAGGGGQKAEHQDQSDLLLGTRKVREGHLK